MADSKITALAAISTVDPTADPLVIVDVSDTSMAASGTTKKSTINQLLGSGGTATLASATITGDLTVDTSTLKVDSANNRVGILTASPTVELEVGDGSGTRTIKLSGVTNVLDLGFGSLRGGSAYGDVRLWTDRFRIYNNAGTQIIKNISGTNGDETWYDGAGGTRMTLNSTGLGVGGVPSGAKVGSIFKLSGVSLEGTASINVSTTPVVLSRVTGLSGLFFVQGYNTSGGAQGWWLVASTGAGTPTVIASGNSTGLTVTFTMVAGALNMNTASGTVAVNAFNITG